MNSIPIPENVDGKESAFRRARSAPAGRYRSCGRAKADAKRFLQEHATLALNRFSRENIERRLRVTYKERYANAPPDAPVHTVQRAEDLIIAVIGGAGKHSAYIPTFGATKSVTRALTRRDGQLARSVSEFKGK